MCLVGVACDVVCGGGVGCVGWAWGVGVGCEVGEVVLGAAEQLVGWCAAHHEEEHTGGCVGAAEVGVEVFGAEPGEGLGGAEDVSSHGVGGVEEVFEFVEDEFGGCVVVALYFVEDDVAFAFDFVLGECRVEDDVGEEVECAVGVSCGYGGVDVGFFFGGVGVELSADGFEA